MPYRTAVGSADYQFLQYRPDVDGLRAVAVLSVVVFHLFRDALPGGYLGVDIFFVISGYLITLVIWREIQGGQFSLIRFYNRRIRRILPAMLAVLFVTTAASAYVLLPVDLIGFNKSMAATLFFVANMHFVRDAQDYFSTAAEVKPLLHMWSLGVEEQFYIFFPLLLVLVTRAWRRGALTVVASTALGSFALDILARSMGAGEWAFYLLPTRAWELGLGAVVALAPVRPGPRPGVWALVALVGAALVLMAIKYPVTSVPIVPTPLPAVVGTALLILAGQYQSHGVSWVLRLRPVMFIGLISYSLYLWHWPIIVLAKYYFVRDLLPLESAAALALMFACAIASWHFVERPFRSKGMPIRTVYLATGTGAALLLVAAVGLFASGGLPGRFAGAARTISESVGNNYRCSLWTYLRVDGVGACAMNLPSRDPADAEVVLLGNSHAKMYAPAWKAILEERGQNGLILWAGSCLPTTPANISVDCIEIARRNTRVLLGLANVHTVVIGLTWWHETDDLVDPAGRVVDNRDNRALVTALDDLIATLRSAGKAVVLIGPIAEPGYEIASVMSRQLAFGHPLDQPTWQSADDFMGRFGYAIEHFSGRNDVAFARPDLVQCPQDKCQYLLDGRALFSDVYHFAAPETLRFRQLFENALAEAHAGQK